MKHFQDRLAAYLPLLVTGLTVKLMLRLLGFRRTFNLLTASKTTMHRTRPMVPLTFRIPYLTCLEDSLAKAREIRKEGRGATLYIGVRGSEDYKFHAWIQPNEGTNITMKFVKINPEGLDPSSNQPRL